MWRNMGNVLSTLDEHMPRQIQEPITMEEGEDEYEGIIIVLYGRKDI